MSLTVPSLDVLKLQVNIKLAFISDTFTEFSKLNVSVQGGGSDSDWTNRSIDNSFYKTNNLHTEIHLRLSLVLHVSAVNRHVQGARH